METKSLSFGLIGFFLGGLIVSIAATNFDKPGAESGSDMSMSQMTDSLKNKTGDDYDKAFIEHMISHHESAVDMAKLSATNAKHDEIKTLSNSIISSQSQEIDQMKQWMVDWGYAAGGASNHSRHQPLRMRAYLDAVMERCKLAEVKDAYGDVGDVKYRPFLLMVGLGFYNYYSTMSQHYRNVGMLAVNKMYNVENYEK